MTKKTFPKRKYQVLSFFWSLAFGIPLILFSLAPYFATKWLWLKAILDRWNNSFESSMIETIIVGVPLCVWMYYSINKVVHYDVILAGYNWYGEDLSGVKHE